MGTKNQPGKFDCYANAHPDEPMFVLLGRDPVARAVVTFWAAMRQVVGIDEPGDPKLKEAYACADAMRAWATANGKGELVERAEGKWKRVFEAITKVTAS